MSTLLRHTVNGVEFVPVNKDNFTLNFAYDSSEQWIQGLDTSSNVVLPEEGYVALNEHLDEVGVQQAMPYNIQIGSQMNYFIADLSAGFTTGQSNAEINIKPFKSKDNVVSNISSTTWQYLATKGKIKNSDMVDIPYVIIKDNQAELLIQCAIMMYVLGDQLAESIATTSRLIAEITGAAIPDTVISASGGTTLKIGDYVKYALLIALELAKAVFLTLALIELTKQMFELIIPPVRYFKGMTFDKLLSIGLTSEGLTYSSSLKQEFRNYTLIGVPIDVQKKKWFEVLGVGDQRILNRGYPTASDTVPTVMSFIDELVKMFNIKPKLIGSVLHLEPKGVGNYLPQVDLQHNMNDQDRIEQRMTADLSGVWNTKILGYTMDSMDKMLWDNPIGMKCEYKATPNNLAPSNEFTTIRGYVDTRINFALATIKKETKVEKELKKVASALDSFLGTNLMSRLTKRDGVMAISSPEFGVTKVIYQRGGKQVANYADVIGANALYKKYHTIDEPKNQIYENYSDMPIQMNNEQFLDVLYNNFVTLEGDEVEVMSCEYSPESTTANISYRKKNTRWGKNIKTELIYESK